MLVQLNGTECIYMAQLTRSISFLFWRMTSSLMTGGLLRPKLCGIMVKNLEVSSANVLSLLFFFIASAISSNASKPLAIWCLLSFPSGIFLMSAQMDILDSAIQKFKTSSFGESAMLRQKTGCLGQLASFETGLKKSTLLCHWRINHYATHLKHLKRKHWLSPTHPTNW